MGVDSARDQPSSSALHPVGLICIRASLNDQEQEVLGRRTRPHPFAQKNEKADGFDGAGRGGSGPESHSRSLPEIDSGAWGRRPRV